MGETLGPGRCPTQLALPSTMRKTFQLNIEGKNRDRRLDAVKHEIRKYVKRERRRALPEGVDYWDFDCKFGADEGAAQVVHLAEIIKLVDGVAKAGAESFYLELLAKHGHRKARPAAPAEAGEPREPGQVGEPQATGEP
jgi:hypothetical protein